MREHNGACDGKTEADTSRRSAPGGFQPNEGLKHVLYPFVWDPWTAVLDPNDRPRCSVAD